MTRLGERLRWTSVGSVVLAALGMVQGCGADDPPASAPETPPPTDEPSHDDGGTGTQGVDASTDPGPPAVRWIGRFDTRDEKGPKVGWPGARVVVRFKGKTLSVKTDEVDLYEGPSRYDVIVDDTVQPEPFVPAEGTADHVLVKDLPEGEHVVELWRRTESLVGTTQFLGFDYGGGELLPPAPAASHRIEIIGDSSTSGYGVECANQNESFSGATENERKSYPAVTAKALGAEHHNVSYAGKGVLRNYDNADKVVFSQLYGRALAEDATSEWSFGSWSPDVVVIALGGNDWDVSENRPAPNVTNFKQRYHELVTLVRSKNPNAHILCTVAASLNDDWPSGYDAYTNMTTILQAIVAERHAAPFDDPKVHYHELPRAQSTTASGGPDLSGCEGHPNPEFHAKVGADLAAKIESITGW